MNPLMIMFIFPGELQKMLTDPAFWVIVGSVIIAMFINATVFGEEKCGYSEFRTRRPQE